MDEPQRDQHDELVHQLDELLEICKDGRAGFDVASEIVSDICLRELLIRGAMQRLRFVHELQSELRRLGADPSESNGAVSPLHRDWFVLRSALRNHDQRAALAECESAEDQTLAAYGEAIGRGLPEPAYSLVRRQELEIRLTHDRLHALRAAG